MSTVRIEIRRDDLRGIVGSVRRGEVSSAVGWLAAIFADADDIEAQTLGFYLDLLADNLPEYQTDDDE